MTQVKKYRIGTYIWVNGELVLKQHNRTYRGKPTKHIEEQNDSEIRRGIKFIALYILCAVSYSAITATNNIVLEVEAEGVKSADVVVEDVAPVSYEGIPFIEEVKAEEVKVEDLSVEGQIRAIAEEKGFKWADYLVRLANCESKLKPNNSNSKGNTPAGSVDRGLFQINSYWHKEVSDACAYDIRCSTEWTIGMIEAGRQSAWVCDRIIN